MDCKFAREFTEIKLELDFGTTVTEGERDNSEVPSRARTLATVVSRKRNGASDWSVDQLLHAKVGHFVVDGREIA